MFNTRTAGDVKMTSQANKISNYAKCIQHIHSWLIDFYYLTNYYDFTQFQICIITINYVLAITTSKGRWCHFDITYIIIWIKCWNCSYTYQHVVAWSVCNCAGVLHHNLLIHVSGVRYITTESDALQPVTTSVAFNQHVSLQSSIRRRNM